MKSVKLPSQSVRLPSLAAIQAFEAVARLESYGQAAEALCITPSAVGKRIVQLESLLGRVLFERNSRGVALNASGREYLGQVRVALDLLSDVSMHKRSVARRERLRIVATPTFARQILAPHLGDYMGRHPLVDIEVLLSVPYVDIGPSQADLWVRFGQGRYPGMLSDSLMSDSVFPVCSPEYLGLVGGLKQPSDLSRAALLRCPLDPWKPWFEAAALDWHEPEQGARMVDIGMTIEAARSGQGVALGRRSLISRWLKEGKLVPLFNIEAIPASDYFLCREFSSPVTEVTLSFSLWLKNLCQELSRVP